MDKLESIKNKLKEMNKECKQNRNCIECNYQDECCEKLGFHTPRRCLEMIRIYEKLLDN